MDDFLSNSINEEALRASEEEKNLNNRIDNEILRATAAENANYVAIQEEKNRAEKAEHNLEELRAISNFYYNVNGIYERVCKYVANIFRYDWYLIPYIEKESVKPEKILKDFSKVLNYLDNSYLKKLCGDIALEVIKNGCYYGYMIDSPDGLVI